MLTVMSLKGQYTGEASILLRGLDALGTGDSGQQNHHRRLFLCSYNCDFCGLDVLV